METPLRSAMSRTNVAPSFTMTQKLHKMRDATADTLWDQAFFDAGGRQVVVSDERRRPRNTSGTLVVFLLPGRFHALDVRLPGGLLGVNRQTGLGSVLRQQALRDGKFSPGYLELQGLLATVLSREKGLLLAESTVTSAVVIDGAHVIESPDDKPVEQLARESESQRA